jgi:hypothetical protein
MSMSFSVFGESRNAIVITDEGRPANGSVLLYMVQNNLLHYRALTY